VRPRRLFAALVVLVALGTPAAAQPQPVLRSDGAIIDSTTRTVVVVAPPATNAPSFIAFHSARVEHDLMLFKPTLVGITPAGPARNAALFDRSPAKKKTRFLVPAEGGDSLEVRRDRDRLVLFRGPQSQGSAVAIGLRMFAATTILSAHAPRPLRLLFDARVHLGPAILDGGGMGAVSSTRSCSVVPSSNPTGVSSETGSAGTSPTMRKRSSERPRRSAISSSAGARPSAWVSSPGRVGREAIAAAMVEPIDRRHEAEVALLHQIERLEAAAAISLRHRNDEPEICAQESRARVGRPFDALGERELAVRRQERHGAHLRRLSKEEAVVTWPEAHATSFDMVTLTAGRKRARP